MNLDYAIVNAIILSHSDAEPFIGWIGIEGDKIACICQGRASPKVAREIIDAETNIIMPGLINGHCHGDMTCARGLADDLTLHEQNDCFKTLNFLKPYLQDDDLFYSRQLTYLEAIRFGTTFLMENMYWSIGNKAIKAMIETGINGALANDIRPNFLKPKELMPIQQIQKWKADCEKQRILPVLGTISEEDFSPHLIEKITKTIKDTKIISTQHLAETNFRCELIQSKFGLTPVRFLHEQGALHDKLIGSHCVHIDKEEIQLMAEAKVKVVNTPLCEMKITDGVAPIKSFLKAGIPVGIGTDGALWNNSNDLFREMKGMVLLQRISNGIRELNAQDAFEMATLGGARVFGLEKVTGSLEVGKRADIIMVDAHAPHMRPLRLGRHQNICSSIVYNATGQDVKAVWVSGNLLWYEDTFQNFDANYVIEKVQECSERIAKAIPEDTFVLKK